MKKILFYSLAALLLTSGLLCAQDKFWITIGTDNDDAQLPIWLMQIDDGGNVTKAPVPIVKFPSSGVSNERPTAMSYDSNGNIIVWFGNDGTLSLYRAIVNKNTLETTSVKKMYSPAEDYNSLQSKQIDRRFVSGNGNFDSIQRAFFADAGGTVGSTSVRLTPGADGKVDKQSVSADGTMAASSRSSDIINVQPLNSKGRAVGGSYNVPASSSIYDVDITNKLANGRRILIVNDNSIFRSVVLNGDTGKPLGNSIQLTSMSPGEEDQEIAVDPEGRFVVYSIDGSDAGCSDGDHDVLYFQKLDQSTGEPVGSAKAITSCHLQDAFNPSGSAGVFGIDIMKVQ